MSKTNWSKIITYIMNAKPPRGKAAFTYEMIKNKTGICTSTLSRLVTQSNRRLDYDEGVKLRKFNIHLKHRKMLRKKFILFMIEVKFQSLFHLCLTCTM